MSEEVVELNVTVIKRAFNKHVQGRVEEILKKLLEVELEKLLMPPEVVCSQNR